MIDINQLVMYKDFEHKEIFKILTDIVNDMDNDEYVKNNAEELTKKAFDGVNKMIEMCDAYGLEGNMWQSFLGFLIANNENAFSTACEVVGKVDGTLNMLAKHDLRIFYDLFNYDVNNIDNKLNIECFSMIMDYKHNDCTSKVFNKRIRDRICEFSKELANAKSADEYFDIVTCFYKNNGVGKLGLHKAFRIKNDGSGPKIVPITSIEHIYLDDLVGYELQKKKLTDNTEAFLEGKKANNCLLFGDSGTGKSSSIKAIMNEYYDKGLRMIEIYKHQFKDLSEVIEMVKDRNYKFIIYMDDLSFEDYEIEYKYLKAIIDGGLGKKPDNVLIYATSNRRHLIREKWSDKEDRREDLHASDTVEEKLSLANRFGVSIFYCAPSKKEFEFIVKTLSEKYDIHMSEDELYAEANKWELSHGGLSGRMAQQFITHLLGKEVI